MSSYFLRTFMYFHIRGSNVVNLAVCWLPLDICNGPNFEFNLPKVSYGSIKIRVIV